MMPKYEVRWSEKVWHSTVVEAKDAEDASWTFGDSNDDEIVDMELIDIESIEEWSASSGLL